MNNLFDTLTDVAMFYVMRPSVTWTLMQTSNEGRRGYAFLVVDHDPPRPVRSGDLPHVVANLTSRSLADLSDLVSRWLQQEKRKGTN